MKIIFVNHICTRNGATLMLLYFLDRTRCIAIEVHDEIVDRKNIYELLKRKGFILFEQNETTFGIKKELC